MKSFRPSALALNIGLLTLGTATAQTAVPNGSFEAWQPRSGYEAPQSWQTSDDLFASSGIPIPLQTVSKSTERAGGQFSAKLQGKSLFGAAFIPAILVLGRINTQTAGVVGGAAYTGRPAQLQFQYKFPGLASDSAFVVVTLTRGNLNTPTGQVIGGGSLDLTGGIGTFRLAAVPIQYASSLAPDTLRIFFVTGADVNPPSANAAFFVDDVALSFVPLAAQQPVAASVQVYPNPSASGDFVLSAGTNPALAAGRFTVLDVRGRQVLEEPARPRSAFQDRTIRLHGQPAGLYWLRLDTPQGPLVQRLLVQ